MRRCILHETTKAVSPILLPWNIPTHPISQPRCFPRNQCLLPRCAPSISSHIACPRDHPMARDQNGNRILTASNADSTRGMRSADQSRNPAIAGQCPRPGPKQGSPDIQLERCAADKRAERGHNRGFESEDGVDLLLRSGVRADPVGPPPMNEKFTRWIPPVDGVLESEMTDATIGPANRTEAQRGVGQTPPQFRVRVTRFGTIARDGFHGHDRTLRRPGSGPFHIRMGVHERIWLRR